MNLRFRFRPEYTRSRPRSGAAGCGRLVLLGMLLLGSACASGLPPDTLGPVPARARLYYADGGGIQDSLRLVVREPARWQEVWARATADRRNAPPPRPAVDFEHAMVLVVAAGRRIQGDRIRVDSVGVREERTADGDVRDVLAVIVRTTEGCGLFDAVVFPVEIVRVRAYDGAVRFIDRREPATDCT